MRTFIKEPWGARIIERDPQGRRIQTGASVMQDVPAFEGWNVKQRRAWRKYGIVRV